MPSDVVIAYTTDSELPTAYRLSNSFTGVSGGAEKLFGRALPATQKKSKGTLRSSAAITRAESTWASDSGVGGVGVGGAGGGGCATVMAAPSNKLDAVTDEKLPRLDTVVSPLFVFIGGGIVQQGTDQRKLAVWMAGIDAVDASPPLSWRHPCRRGTACRASTVAVRAWQLWRLSARASRCEAGFG